MQDRYKLGLQGKSSLVLGALLFISLIVTNLNGYWQSRKIAEAKVIELEQSKLSLLKYEIEGNLRHHHKNLLSLRNVPAIKAILRALDNNGIDPQSGDTLQQWNQRLTVTFLAFMKTHSNYQQLRYINANGDEIVRVQANPDGVASVVAKEYLQNKSTSLYVSQTLQLKTGEVYYSDVSLNREHGVIEVPHQPLLRLATPVHIKGTQPTGLIVLNISIDELFSAVHSDTNGLTRSITDEKGYYIKHDDPTKTFGLDRGIDYRLQNHVPELAKLATSNEQYFGRYRHHDNDNDNDNDHDHDHDSVLDGFQKIYFAPNDLSRYWLLYLSIPEHIIFKDINSAFNSSLLISLFFGLTSMFIIVWYISGKILTPVVNLASVARRLHRGDLTARVDETSTQDEFNTLYSAINAFAENQQYATSKLQNEVAKQTKRLSAVIDNIVDGIITIDKHGTIESFNTSAKDIFGYSDKEVIGQNVKMLMPEPYHSEHDGYLKQHNETREKNIIGIGCEVMGRRKDGTTFPMDLAISEVTYEDSVHFIGITRDITQRKLTEQALIESRDESDRANRAKSEFLSSMSHELRTPMNAILGFSQLLQFDDSLSDNSKDNVQEIHDAGEHLLELINEVLDLSRIESGQINLQLEAVDVRPIIENCISLVAALADKRKIQISHNGIENIAVRADRTRLKQVLLNLISNAIKYNREAGTVTLEVQCVDENRLRILVTDTGPGIPAARLNELFQPFNRLDLESGAIEGTGIGLTITRSLIEMMNGTIEVKSEVGVGSTFWIELPIEPMLN
jgi:PAS domain S-box-containing protein